MKPYVVYFTDVDGNEAQSRVVAANQHKASLAFAAKHPDIDRDQVQRIVLANEQKIEHASSDKADKTQTQSSSTGTGDQSEASNAVANTPTKDQYTVARIGAEVLDYVGWFLIIMGAILALPYLGEERAMYMGTIMSGLDCAIAVLRDYALPGLGMIVGARVAKAIFDMATYTRAIMEGANKTDRG